MNLSDLRSSQLKQALSLLNKKETLQNQIAGLERKISAIFGGDAAMKTPVKTRAPRGSGKAPGRVRGGAKRGDLKAKILSELKGAGETGVSIKELTGKLKAKSANLHAWFGSTGKKIEGLEKIGPAKYRLVAGVH